MTHRGDGPFVPATGRRIHARTIADCVCRDNRVIHEWLVRDQAAIARQIGLHERDLAQAWLMQRGPIAKPPMPPVPSGYRSHIDTGALATAYRKLYEGLWAGRGASAVLASHDRAAILEAPAGQTLYGHLEIHDFWTPLLTALPRAQFALEHLTEVQRPGRNCSGHAMAGTGLARGSWALWRAQRARRGDHGHLPCGIRWAAHGA